MKFISAASSAPGAVRSQGAPLWYQRSRCRKACNAWGLSDPFKTSRMWSPQRTISLFEAFVEVFAGDPCLVVDEDLHFEIEDAGLVVEGGGGAFAEGLCDMSYHLAGCLARELQLQ